METEVRVLKGNEDDGILSTNILLDGQECSHQVWGKDSILVQEFPKGTTVAEINPEDAVEQGAYSSDPTGTALDPANVVGGDDQNEIIVPFASQGDDAALTWVNSDGKCSPPVDEFDTEQANHIADKLIQALSVLEDAESCDSAGPIDIADDTEEPEEQAFDGDANTEEQLDN
jgi:hypothetical protein